MGWFGHIWRLSYANVTPNDTFQFKHLQYMIHIFIVCCSTLSVIHAGWLPCWGRSLPVRHEASKKWSVFVCPIGGTLPPPCCHPCSLMSLSVRPCTLETKHAWPASWKFCPILLWFFARLTSVVLFSNFKLCLPRLLRSAQPFVRPRTALHNFLSN